jgi:F-type H+-transporting ATPase subunit alpha
MSVGEQVLIIYAGVNGFVDDIPVSKLREFEQDLLSYIGEKHAGIKSDLVGRKKIDEEFGEQLKQIITEFKKTKRY